MNWREYIIKAPAVPIAIAATAGVLADRACELRYAAMIGVAVVGLCIWLLVPRMWVVGVGLVVAGAAALHHHAHRHSFSGDDIGNLATDERRLVHLAGQIV